MPRLAIRRTGCCAAVRSAAADGYDANGNPTHEARSHESGAGDVYTYDRADRLVKALIAVDDPAAEVASPGSRSYATKLEYNMDDVHNLTTYVTTPYGGSATTASYTTNALNLYTAVAGTAHTYDANGNLKDDGTRLYKYDGWNRLIEVKDKATNAVQMTANFDAYPSGSLRGRRFEKTVGSTTTRTIHSGEEAIEDYEAGSLARKWVHDDGIDRPVMMEAPDTADVDSDSNTTELKRFYYHGQLIGSVTHLTDESQAVRESYSYDPYGKVTIKDKTGSTVTATQVGNPWMNTGRQWDKEAGLYHYRARAYSPELRRFIQRDPKEYVDGMNAGAYVGARATGAVDPYGTDFLGIGELIEDAAEVVADVGEFIWTLPTNAVGGLLKGASGDMSGGCVTTDCWFIIPGAGLTMGDFQFYGDATPTGDLQAHEGAHTSQSDVLGPLYLPMSAAGWAACCCSLGLITPPLETHADWLSGTSFYK